MGTTSLASQPSSFAGDPRTGRHERLSLVWLIPILGVLASAAIGIGVLALTSAPSTNSLRTQVTALQADVGSLHAQLAAQRRALSQESRSLAASQTSTKATIASLRMQSDTAASAGDLNRLTMSVHRLLVCVPQLQQELSGLSVQATNQSGWLTGASISNPTITSRDCSQTLYGAPAVP